MPSEDLKGHSEWPFLSPTALRADLKNAGAEWVDQGVVHDGKMVTSRKPDDSPAFNREMLKLFAEAKTPAHAA